MSPTSPMWPSLSGFTIELTAWIWPSAMSSAMTPITSSAGEDQRAGLAVHLDLAERRSRDPLALPHPGAQRARDALAALHRARERGRLAAAVAVQHDVVGEQRLERLELTLLGGGEEAPRQLVALLARGLEARPALLDVAARPCRELARVVLALADDLGDLARSRSRTRRAAGAPLAAPGDRLSSRTRNASESESASSAWRAGSAALSATSGSGSHSPTYVSRRTRAERSWSIESRVATVARYARGDSIRSRRSSASWRRRSASWTTSSASATLPSIR